MPTSFSGYPAIGPVGPFQSETTSEAVLGQMIETPDGRKFRYCLVGGTALVPGKLYQSPAEVTNHQDLTPTAATAIGDTSITVTLGATAATANQYAGGWVTVTTGTGAGYQYRISSHPAADASATLALTLDDAILVATNASTTRVDLVLNPYSGVILNPTTASGAAVGVAVYAAAASTYSWLQSGGPCAVLSDGGDAVGTEVVASNGTAGAVEDVASTTQAIVGTRMTGVATGEYGMVNLTID
jgi:hypothetical protein